MWDTTRKGRPRRKAAGWQPVSAYTGAVCFYDSIHGNKADYWVDWSAVFVSGKLTEIRLLTWEERDNCERLKWAAEMKGREGQRERFLATWLGRRIYPIYAWAVHGCFGTPIFRLCNWIGNRVSRVGIRIHRIGDRLAPYGDPIRAAQRHRRWSELFDDDDDDDVSTCRRNGTLRASVKHSLALSNLSFGESLRQRFAKPQGLVRFQHGIPFST